MACHGKNGPRLMPKKPFFEDCDLDLRLVARVDLPAGEAEDGPQRTTQFV